jgi:hypothetical protein
VIVLRPGDPAPTDFDPADAQRIAELSARAGAGIYGDEAPSDALAMGTFSVLLEKVATEALEIMATLIAAELTARGRPE